MLVIGFQEAHVTILSAGKEVSRDERCLQCADPASLLYPFYLFLEKIIALFVKVKIACIDFRFKLPRVFRGSLLFFVVLLAGSGLFQTR